MRVLHLETGRQLYGGAQQVVYLLSGLREEAQISSILVCPPESDMHRKGAFFADETHTLSMRGEADVGFLGRFLALLRRVRPDIVHIHSRRGADIWGGIAAKLNGTPAVLTRRVDNPEAAWMVRWKYALYDRIIAISRGIQDILKDEGVPEEKLVCVPSAVPSRHYEQPCRRSWFLREFQLKQNAVTIAVIAQFIERKGHRYLLEVLPEITQKFPEVHVLFFGKGPLEEEIKRKVSDSGLGDKAIFAGFRQDLEHILPCLNLVVHPATMEGLGVSLLQASSAGVPIVAFACGGVPEVVQNGYNGFTVKPGDVNGLKNAVTTILNDEQQAASLGNNGRRLVKEHFSVEAMVQGNVSVYRDMNVAQAR